jgi:hypothetical protein
MHFLVELPQALHGRNTGSHIGSGSGTGKQLRAATLFEISINTYDPAT